MKIDLRSDTLTRPTPEMIRAMAQAESGDDAYGEAKNVIELQEYCAEYFGKPAALFTCSGTMSNQIALRSLTVPGDEVVCDASYHINFFESAQGADLGKIVLNAMDTPNGILTPEVLEKAVEQKCRWNDSYAAVSLVWLENSVCARGGRVIPLDTVKELSAWCSNSEIPIFIDGARILNASIAAEVHASEYAACAHALSMCFSKGLGAPFGSILVGSRDFIARAKRFRKWYGGALHQSGFMAAAALYALKNNIGQLHEDHANAVLLKTILNQHENIHVHKVETNVVLFDVRGVSSAEFVNAAKEIGVGLMPWRTNTVRAMTSSNVNREQVIEAGNHLLAIASSLSRTNAAHDYATVYL